MVGLPIHYRSDIRLLYAAQFVAIGAYLPFMPVWLADRGLSAGEIGLVLTLPMLARSFVAPALALGVDRRGDRRAPLAALAALSGGATMALFLLTGLAAILAGFAALALFWCALMPLTEASALAAARAGRGDYGRMRLWGSVSFIAANLGAGMLVDEIAPGAAVALVAGAFLLSGLFALRLPRDDAQELPAVADGLTLAAGRALLGATFLGPIVLAGLMQSSHAVLYGFGTLHWQSLGYSNTMIGWLWATGVIAEIVLFAFSARPVRWLRPTGLLVLAAAAGVTRWTAMAFDPPLAAQFALQVLHAFTFAAVHLASVTLIANGAPRRLAGTAQSLLFAVSSLIMAATMPLAGALYGAVGGGAYWAMAAMALAVLAVLAVAPARRLILPAAS